jgi:phage gp29-like protein
VPDAEEEAAPQAALMAEEADPVPVLADGAEAVAAAAVDAMIERVRGLLAEVGSLEEFRARLLEIEPGIGTEDLAERLRMALVFAELSGRDDIGG